LLAKSLAKEYSMKKLTSEKANVTVPGTVGKVIAPTHPRDPENAQLAVQGEEQACFSWDTGYLSETELSSWLETEKQIDAKMHTLEEPELKQSDDAPSRDRHKAA
jgi:hypothetical protein